MSCEIVKSSSNPILLCTRRSYMSVSIIIRLLCSKNYGCVLGVHKSCTYTITVWQLGMHLESAQKYNLTGHLVCLYDALPMSYLMCFWDLPDLVSCAFSAIPLFLSFNSQNILFTCMYNMLSTFQWYDAVWSQFFVQLDVTCSVAKYMVWQNRVFYWELCSIY